MPEVLTRGERLERLDREVESLKDGFVEAVAHLQDAPDVDRSFEERLAAIIERLRSLRTELRPADYDREQVATIFGALYDIRDRVDERHDFDVLDELLILIERVRHVVRDALDEHVSGGPGSAALCLEELETRLPTTTKDALAELLGVDRRTLPRWRRSADAPPARLRIVSKLAAILAHDWTEDGIVAWFRRPRRDLDGTKPIDLLRAGAIDEDRLVSAARAGRSQYAS